MDIWKHCLLSQRKFGGEPGDYYAIHRFIDSSKLTCFHAKHRLLLHNSYGIELASELFQDHLTNSAGKVILVRDIAAEHCKEDLSGIVPSLYDWLRESDADLSHRLTLPQLSDQPSLEAFVLRPYLRSGLQSALMITCSDFGIMLAELFLGVAAAKTLAERLPAGQRIKPLLRWFRFTQRWQYTPLHADLQWLREQEAQTTITTSSLDASALASVAVTTPDQSIHSSTRSPVRSSSRKPTKSRMKTAQATKKPNKKR